MNFDKYHNQINQINLSYKIIKNQFTVAEIKETLKKSDPLSIIQQNPQIFQEYPGTALEKYEKNKNNPDFIKLINQLNI